MIDPAKSRILITGAAGEIGTALRLGLRNHYRHLLLTDLRPVADVAPNETFIPADIADRAALTAMMRGVDALVHMTGVPAQHTLEDLFRINARGVFDAFEVARLAGVKRIVFASSNHAFGCYPLTTPVTPDAPPRPDSFYGVFKVMGETVLRYYHDRHGIDSVSLRIGTFRPQPIDQRSLASWLSPRDAVQLVDRSLRHPAPGCLVINAYSGNTRLKVRDPNWDFLGYHPQDDAETYVDALRAQRVDVDGPWEWHEHGGAFVHQPEKPTG